MTTSTRIPFEVETSRVIELLAKQIYQSPLALLRENVQNAFDAVRERASVDQSFEPRIDVEVTPTTVSISDNGIGMSKAEIRKHFWTAGSSSKNTDSARAAGVVGTFGIGAMANFGVANVLEVETESYRTSERTRSKAELDNLSLSKDCVEVTDLASAGEPGTRITVQLQHQDSISPTDATEYVRSFTRLLEVPVSVNGQRVSMQSIDRIVPKIAATTTNALQNERIGARLRASGEFAVDANATVRVDLNDLVLDGRPIPGRLVLLSATRTLSTTRSGFGLAIAPVNSLYGFGGVADLLVLEPTAGREAITSDGIALLQAMLNEIDDFVSLRLSELVECDVSTPFMTWVQRKGRFDLAGKLKIDQVTSSSEKRTAIQLNEVARQGQERREVFVYEGSDPTVIKTFATNETATLLLLSRTQPRRACQNGFIVRQKGIQTVPNEPTVLNRRSGYEVKGEEWFVAFRIETLVSTDYFIEVAVDIGEISHGVGLVVDTKKRDAKTVIILNTESQNVRTLIQVYSTHPMAFSDLAKDFVRTVVFPQIAHLVPSSTREGAQAFLESIKRKRETFEYDDDDAESLSTFLDDYDKGNISLDDLRGAIERSSNQPRSNVQVVEHATSINDIAPDLIENERSLADGQDEHARTQTNGNFQWPAEPSILRSDTSSDVKLTTIEPTEPHLRGYRCFISLTPRVYKDFGSFFAQPHSTSVVWGGQKTLFIFMHHSGEFGLYYDLQTAELLDAPAGGGSQRTSTIVLKNRIYIPVPNAIASSFVPGLGERKRFEIKADIIRTTSAKSATLS